MTLNSAAVITNGAAGRTLTIGPASFTHSGTINVNTGAVTISATNWTNPGSIVVGAAGTLNLAGTLTATSIGSIQSNAGGTVNITGTINNASATLTLNALTGSWSLLGGVINGGTVNLTGGSTLIATTTASTLNGVAVNGELVLNSSGRINLSGATSVTTIRLAGPNSSLGLTADTVLSNSTIIFEGAGGGSRIIGTNGQAGTVTLTSTVAIQVAAGLGANPTLGDTNMTLNSAATITNSSIRSLAIIPAAFTNSGTINAASGVTAISSANWTNAGSLIVGSTGTLNLGGTLTTSALGSLQGGAGGVINITGAISNTGSTLNINDGTGTFNIAGGSITGGVVNISGSARLQATNSGGTLSNVTVNGEVFFGTSASLTLTGTLSVTLLHLSGPTPTWRSPPAPTSRRHDLD